MNNEQEIMWKGAVVAEFKVLTRNLPGGTEENTKNLNYNRQFPCRDWTRVYLKYDSDTLPLC
jgi:hypothetical protein